MRTNISGVKGVAYTVRKIQVENHINRLWSISDSSLNKFLKETKE